MNEYHPPQPNERLRQARIERNWRQHDIADQVGTTVVTVNRWERGNQQPGAYFRVKLCALFGKSAEELGLVTNMLPQLAVEQKVSISQEDHVPFASPARPALWTIPYRRNPYFTGRDEYFHQLEQHFSPERQKLSATMCCALTQPRAIKGPGGIGKTQIAVEYAYRALEQDRYTHTFWINATSKEALLTSFTLLAKVLPELPVTSETNQRELVDAVKRWLEQCPVPWLLIFDNADDLSLVQESFPLQGNGCILFTTRANAVGSFAASVEVEKMGFVEGTQLLLHRAQRFMDTSDEAVNEAGNIVVALDHFPLALEQAGAYIEEIGCSFQHYLQLYQSHRRALLARRGAQTTNYPDSVATTWSLSFQKIEQANPAAAELLQLCAFLAPDHIPEELIVEGRAHWPPALQQAAADPLTFDQLFEVLLTFSLVKRLRENHLFSIHRLVQAVQQERVDTGEQRRWAERVIAAVDTVFPLDSKNDRDTWPVCLRYLEQVQACAALLQQWKLLQPAGAELLGRVCSYLYEQGSYDLAEPLYQLTVQIWEQCLGPEHPKVASSLRVLANLYNEQSCYTEAEVLFHRAIRIWEQHTGPEHLDVADPLNGLAELYWKQGRFAEAEQLFQRVLRIREQSLGSEHLLVAFPLSGLAEIYREQGRYAEALPLCQHALYIREPRLGPEHRLVVSVLNTLAEIYRQQGRYTEAEPLYHRIIRTWQALSPDYPRLGTPLSNLAHLYNEQGRYAEAEPLYRRALCIWEQQLGPEHPGLGYSLHGLGELYRVQGRYAEAEPLFRRACRLWEQKLGTENPLVAHPLEGLAELCQNQGRYAEAEQLFQRVLHIWEQSLGSEHPLVTYPLNGLAQLRRDQGQYIEAEQLFLHARSIGERAADPDLAQNAIILHELAILYEIQGKSGEAQALYSRTLAIREKIHGFHHPKTLETRKRLQALAETADISYLSFDEKR